MATETIKKRTAGVQLENGTDAYGNVKTVLLSLGTLAKDRWDGDKALAIASALEPCLSKTVSTVEGTSTFTVNPAN